MHGSNSSNRSERGYSHALPRSILRKGSNRRHACCHQPAYSIGHESESTSKPLRKTTPLVASAVTVSAADVLAALLVSPLYVAFKP